MAERGELAQEPYGNVAETPSAVVFFAGDRAYKLKKPVNLGFLDFTDRQARLDACVRETELNRRFAPDVYLGVAELRHPDGQLCEHLVVMRRMPAGRRLSALVKADDPVAESLRHVARILAAQHASSRRSARIAEQGSADALRRRWDDNLEQTIALAGQLLGAPTLDETGRLARRFLAGREPLFQARISGDHIVDGHGDLLADDIYCLEDGPRILDCLDFDDRLRWLDGLDDAAFLAMDLERLGAPDLARQFSGWYAEFSGDPAPGSLRHHYIAYRAFVRVKVACIHAAQGNAAGDGQAHQLAGIALRHLRAGAVTLVLIGGLPGTGKSTLAGAVADRLGWTVLSNDRIRKELANLPPQRSAASPYGTGIYTAEWTERTYAELLRRAAVLLEGGESVIADSSWISLEQRAAAAAVARDLSADLVQLRCTASPILARQRLRTRQPGVSDADAEIARQMAAAMAPWPAATTIDSQSGGLDGPIGPSGAFGQLVEQVLDAVRPHGPEHVWRPSRPVMRPD